MELLEYASGPPHLRPPPGRRAWVVALVALTVVVVGALVVADRDGAEGEGSATSTTVADDHDNGEAAVAELTPQAAWDGRDSLLLPVSVSPASGLRDGQYVTVTGAMFPPEEDIGAVMCTTQAVEFGVSACDIGDVVYGETRRDGTFSLTFPVRRFVDIAGSRVDCTEGNIDPAEWAATREAGLPPLSVTDASRFSCIIGVGLLSDYDQSGGFPISFEGAVTGPGAPPPDTVPPVTLPDCPDYSQPPPTRVYEIDDGTTKGRAVRVEADVAIPIGCPPPPPEWYRAPSGRPAGPAPTVVR